jgi:hypothetical protein
LATARRVQLSISRQVVGEPETAFC